MNKFEKGIINRTAITIIPKEPFWTWYQSIAKPEFRQFRATEFNTYLLDETLALGDYTMALGDYWDFVFRNELSLYCEEEELWPANRSLEMFDDWFEAKFGSSVLDLVPFPIEYEEDY